MDEFIDALTSTSSGDIAAFTPAELALAFALAAALSIILTQVYRYTHTGMAYSRSFALSLVIMCVTVAFIMMIIGSNLARAFSLVGALSIIRFRNPVKDSRDTAYIFMTMAVGMACGVRLYSYAIVFTVAVGALLIVLEKVRFGETRRSEHLLELRASLSFDAPDDLESRVGRAARGRATLLSAERLEDARVLVYSVEVHRGVKASAVMDTLADELEGVEVRVLTGADTVTP
jgi:uncharacterized membrane protein YhiD involved in acid resistance